MDLVKRSWFQMTILFLCMPNWAIAQSFTVKFVDQNNQAIQFVVATDPSLTGTPSELDSTPAIMDQIDKQFSPMVIAVAKGRKVSFPNSDNIRHHVYSFSKAKRFETKLYANKPEAPILFDQSGLVVLGCNIHDNMIGYIFVTPWRYFDVSDAMGITRLAAKQPPKTIEYWHPWSKQPNQVITYAIDSWPKNGPLTIQLTINPPIMNPATFNKGFGKRW